MKKIIFLLSFICSASFLFGQEEVGSYQYFVGGSIGFENRSESDADFRTRGFDFSPYIGYSVNENLILGLSLGYQRVKIDMSDDPLFELYSITPFTRYRKAISDKMGFYGEFGIQYSHIRLDVSDGGEQFPITKQNLFTATIGPGIDYAFAKRWVINAGWGILNYSTIKSVDADNRRNIFNLDMNPANINFSLNYLF